MAAERVPYVSMPYVGPSRAGSSQYGLTLADLISRRGQQEAAMHLQRGDDQARAWQQAGGVVHQAVQNWQQQASDRRRAALEAADREETSRLRGLQLRQAEGALRDQDTARAERAQGRRADSLFASYFVQGDDGVADFDMKKIASELEAEGLGGEIPRLMPAFEGIQQTARQFRQQQRESIANVFGPMAQQAGDINPESVKMLTAYLRANKMAPADELDQIDAQIDAHPERVRDMVTGIVSASPAAAQKWLKADEYTLKPGETRFRGAEQVAAVPAEEKAPANIEAAILEAERAGNTAEADRLIRLKKDLAAAGRAPAPPPAAEPLVAITGPDGRPVLVPRSEAVGKAPANTREQGRQVTSGDAGDIAEFNTALDDLASLRKELEGNGATGTSAQALANLWTPITNLTGWGADAKAKQAQIDRVKQVIGKALEGGVLRKEDELKYEKILPTIKDSPELVQSKLNGLVKAIQRRQQRKLDALDSAGYDVSRFGTPGAESASMVTMRAPNGETQQVRPEEVAHYKALGAVVVP